MWGEIVIDNLIHEITKEYEIVTVINSHDMNSVMEIGEKIIFLKDGEKAWEGSKETIFRTDNEAVSNFVYSSSLFKKVRKMYLKGWGLIRYNLNIFKPNIFNKPRF